MDATDGSIDRGIGAMTQRLASGLHELAITAGHLEEALAGRDPAELDDEIHLALDQAHSNASALLRALDRVGLG